MTETLAGSDVEILEFLDFEESKACEGTRSPKCDREAVAVAIHNCCGFSYLLCEGHLRELRDLVANFAGRLRCNRCGTDPAPMPTIFPLGG